MDVATADVLRVALNSILNRIDIDEGETAVRNLYAVGVAQCSIGDNIVRVANIIAFWS